MESSDVIPDPLVNFAPRLILAKEILINDFVVTFMTKLPS